MNTSQLEAKRVARLAEGVLKSIREAANEVWKAKCRSDRPIKLSRNDKVRFSAVLPAGKPTGKGRRVGAGMPVSKVIGALPKVALKRKRYKYNDRKAQPVKKIAPTNEPLRYQELLAKGINEELAIQIIKEQARKIRLPKELVTQAQVIRRQMEAEGSIVSLRDACLIAQQLSNEEFINRIPQMES